jgi:hypothetical protein
MCKPLRAQTSATPQTADATPIQRNRRASSFETSAMRLRIVSVKAAMTRPSIASISPSAEPKSRIVVFNPYFASAFGVAV